MTAALTIAVLLALSTTIVRIASVALRHTGVPDHIARFQTVSALSGAGFTTNETEMIVNHPLRRKIITAAIIAGNIGLASVATTLIVAFVGTGMDTQSTIWQAATIALAIGFTLFVMLNRTVDRTSCRVIGRLLTRFGSFKHDGFTRLAEIAPNHSVAEHVHLSEAPVPLYDLFADHPELNLLIVRKVGGHSFDRISEDLRLEQHEVLVTCGPDAAQQRLAEALAEGRSSQIMKDIEETRP
ncbi:MAG: hypothetical protein CMH88_16325 [Oceanibulbus sp.]|nr:hypothetical protein [Sulfitobacter sp.]HBC16622.1 hypothetical protein [Erythrobacter sp.]